MYVNRYTHIVCGLSREYFLCVCVCVVEMKDRQRLMRRISPCSSRTRFGIHHFCRTTESEPQHTHTNTLRLCYRLTRRNILPYASKDFLRNCTFDPHSHHSLYCPIMSLQYIVDHIKGANANFTELSKYVCVNHWCSVATLYIPVCMWRCVCYGDLCVYVYVCVCMV